MADASAMPVSPARMYRDNQEREADNAVLSSPFSWIGTYNISIFYWLWYLFVTHWNLANYVAFARVNDTLLNGKPSAGLYLAMVIFAMLAFWLVGGPMLFYSIQYAKGQKKRLRWLSLGLVIMYVVTDIPLWICDMSIVYFYGWMVPVQTITWVLRSFSFLFQTVIVWHIYLHRMSKLLHQWLWSKRTDLAEIAARQIKDAELVKRKAATKKARQEREAARRGDDDDRL